MVAHTLPKDQGLQNPLGLLCLVAKWMRVLSLQPQMAVEVGMASLSTFEGAVGLLSSFRIRPSHRQALDRCQADHKRSPELNSGL